LGMCSGVVGPWVDGFTTVTHAPGAHQEGGPWVNASMLGAHPGGVASSRFACTSVGAARGQMEGRPAGRSLCVQVRAPGEGAVLGEMRVRLISWDLRLRSVSSRDAGGPCHGVRVGTLVGVMPGCASCCAPQWGRLLEIRCAPWGAVPGSQRRLGERCGRSVQGTIGHGSTGLSEAPRPLDGPQWRGGSSRQDRKKAARQFSEERDAPAKAAPTPEMWNDSSRTSGS